MNVYKNILNTDFGKFYIAYSDRQLRYAGFRSFTTLENIKYFQTEGNKNSVFIQQFSEYFAGKRKNFDLRFDIPGTDFEKEVYQKTSNITYGKTKSYGDIANAINNPRAARAVGNALSKNNLLLVIPCHRVIKTNGEYGKFGNNDKLKENLIKFEQLHK